MDSGAKWIDPELQRLRDSIDNIDAALIHVLAERFKCTKAVGELKARRGMPAADPARETRQIARLRALAHEAKLDPDFAEKFLAFIVQEVIRHHEAIKGSGPKPANHDHRTRELNSAASLRYKRHPGTRRSKR